MKTWNQLFIRQGWLLQEYGQNMFDCVQETEENMTFLLACLDNAQASYIYSEGKQTLQMTSAAIREEAWLQIVDVPGRGRTEYISTWKEYLQVKRLDVYISGIVRQLNRLNLKTVASCDGHGETLAKIFLLKEDNVDLVLLENLLALELPSIRHHERNNWITFILGRRSVAHLNLAETLSKIRLEWLQLGIETIKQQLYNATLEELLMVPGASGSEGRIRKVLMEKLTPYVDHMTVDGYGNILAEKTYRTGNGPTILLNAHLDVVEELIDSRKIVKDNGVWSSSEGILGADDRAGVAVILQLAKTLNVDKAFSGKVKFIFTVEEEIGLVGARNVAEYFLWDVDAAIVIDRRGTGDIVTSCGGYIPFCGDAYGQWIEQLAIEAGLEGWQCTAGGSSDTRIWAQHGIQSVNLSAGYYNEHTEAEALDVNACYNTVKLVKAILKNGGSLRSVLRTDRQQLERIIIRKEITKVRNGSDFTF